MSAACRLVPSLFLLLALAPGCYELHGADGCGPPAGMVCCSAAGEPIRGRASCPFACPTGTVLRDASRCTPGAEPLPVVDAGSPTLDAGLTCPAVRADYTCLESSLVEPGIPFTLPLSFDTCACCAEAACTVEVTRVDGAPTLRLDTTLCPDPCDCGVCVTPEAHCAVPGLEIGEWNVVVNGAPAFVLPVVPDPGFGTTPPTCIGYAAADRCRSSEATLEVTDWRPHTLCVDEQPWEGGRLTTLSAIHDCWNCDLDGPCEVMVEPRFTDDLPPGGEIRVTPTRRPTECDDPCLEVCMMHERRCAVPPLTPGHYYRVWIDGDEVLGFVAGESPRVCASDH